MKIVLIMIVAVFWGCSPLFSNSTKHLTQPSVVWVTPSDGELVEELTTIQAALSLPIDSSTVHEKSFLIVPAEMVQEDLRSLSTGDLADKIDDEELVSLNGSYSFSADSTLVSWNPTEKLDALASYYVVLTSRIQTPDHIPLNQIPDSNPTYFVSRFTLQGEVSSSVSSEEGELAPAFLLINEIYYDDAESDTDGNLFIELYGSPSADVSGYIIRFVNGDDGEATDEIVLPESTFLHDNGLLVIADLKTGSSDETDVLNADLLDNFDPQNGPDSIQLLTPAGDLIDVVGYGDGWGNEDLQGNFLYEGEPAVGCEAGQSLSRVNYQDTQNNLNDFVINTVPSPGSGEVTPLVEASREEEPAEETGESETALEIISNDIHFTEVVTDPQQDWGDTEGGNGIAFDAYPGSGTVGTTDEWIEIANGRDETVDLTGWRVEMIDGTDATEWLTDTEFQPDEFLVLGNPEGDLKNTTTLKLYDQVDALIDELVVEDANADSLENESYQLTDDGWMMGEATIGF